MHDTRRPCSSTHVHLRRATPAACYTLTAGVRRNLHTTRRRRVQRLHASAGGYANPTMRRYNGAYFSLGAAPLNPAD